MPLDREGPQAALTELSALLWRERRLLELLAFKLDVEQSLLATARGRWLHHVTREIEAVCGELREVDLARAVAVERARVPLALLAEPSLSELADAAPAPWGELLREHRAALLAATAQILDLAEANRTVLARGWRAARAALGALAGLS